MDNSLQSRVLPLLGEVQITYDLNSDMSQEADDYRLELFRCILVAVRNNPPRGA